MNELEPNIKDGWRPLMNKEHADEVEKNGLEIKFYNGKWFARKVGNNNDNKLTENLSKKLILEQKWRTVTKDTYDEAETNPNLERRIENGQYQIRPKSTTSSDPNQGGGSTGEKVKEWIRTGWESIEDALKVGVGGAFEVAGQVVREVSILAGETIDQAAKRIQQLGGKVYEMGGKLYTNLSNAAGGLTVGGGGSASPISALPPWVDGYPCVKGANPIPQGQNVTVFDGKRVITLSEDGKCQDALGYSGTWVCESPTSLAISMSSSKTVSGGAGASGGGGAVGACSQNQFPECVRNLQYQETPCSFKGFAETNDGVEYQVIYYAKKVQGPDGSEQFSCMIYKNGWMPAYYACGVTGPIITSDIGQLTGTNKGATKVISSKDRGTILAKLKSIPDFITTNEEGTQIIDIDDSKLEQAISEIQQLVKEGYRGLSIRYFIKFLQQSETLLETELNQAKSIITQGLAKLQNVINNNVNSGFDPDYVVDLDPPARLLGQNKYETFNYPIPALSETFKVYRSKAWRDRTKTTQATSAYAEKVKKEGLTEKDCEEALKFYMISINKGQMVGASTTGASSGEYDSDSAKETIKACSSAGLYSRGFLRGNKRYQDAIKFLATLPEERGGIDFDKVQ